MPPRAAALPQEDERLRDAPTDPRLRPAADAPAAEPSVKPGDDDRARFKTLHWSVDMWKPFVQSKWLESIDNEAAPVSGARMLHSCCLLS